MTITPHDLDAFIQFAEPLVEQSGEHLSWGQLLEQWRSVLPVDRTPLVQTLDQSREAFVADGGMLLSDDEVYAEAKLRRGGIDGAPA